MSPARALANQPQCALHEGRGGTATERLCRHRCGRRGRDHVCRGARRPRGVAASCNGHRRVAPGALSACVQDRASTGLADHIENTAGGSGSPGAGREQPPDRARPHVRPADRSGGHPSVTHTEPCLCRLGTQGSQKKKRGRMGAAKWAPRPLPTPLRNYVTARACMAACLHVGASIDQ